MLPFLHAKSEIIIMAVARVPATGPVYYSLESQERDFEAYF